MNTYTYQGVQLGKAQHMLYDHVRTVIFEEHELRTVQTLLSDYECIITNFGSYTLCTKSSYAK